MDGQINGDFISREEYLENKIKFKDNRGGHSRSLPSVWHGFIVDIAFNKNINASVNPFCEEEVRIRFNYWNEIGRPLQIEKAKEITERTIFVRPESVLEEKVS